MSLIRKIIVFIFFTLFPFSHSFANVVTLVDEFQVSNGDEHTTVRAGLSINTDREVGGVQFNDDGTKMFVRFFRDEDGGADPDTEDFSYIDEYNLSIPFDASSGTYAGDDERCELDHSTGIAHEPFDLNFSSDGKHLYVANRFVLVNGQDKNFVYRFDLTTPYDISTCTFAQRTRNIGNFINGSRAGDSPNAIGNKNNRTQGVSLSNDGKKMFVLMNYGHVLEYDLSIAFDVTTYSLNVNGGMDLSSNTSNPQSIEFNADGTRIFIANHGSTTITQVSLDAPFDTSSFTVDGEVSFTNTTLGNLRQIRTVTFSNSGLIMYIGEDDSSPTHLVDKVFEYNLACPFDIIGGNCPSITQNSDRTGMAEAQVELANRTIDLSTKSVLNRLKWIRRNKDKQNLSNQNIKLNFSNSLISSLSELPLTSFKKVSTNKNNVKSNKNYFYWSEGGISIGRIGDTSISSNKEINVKSLTFGFDKFKDDYGIEGIAFRFGGDDVDVGNSGSNLDSKTYNFIYYNTTPIDDDSKFIDKVFGIGKIKSDIITIVDGRNITADRIGNQAFGTFKLKDEIKKNRFTLIPSAQFDFGHTILRGYTESGVGAIDVEDQHVRTKNLRATIAVYEDVSNDKYEFKQHAKLEYLANVDRSSDFKYKYVSDSNTSFSETLHTGALHNINTEVGLDIVFSNNYSIFVIYERNQAIDYGYTDNLYIALGYLPYEGAEYAFTINGSENLLSKLEFKKSINGLNLSFNVNDDLTNLGDNREANIVLNKVF